MDKELIIGKLKDYQSQITELKKRDVSDRWGAQFENWHSSLLKWLKLGLPHTQSELAEIQRKSYMVPRGHMGSDDYDSDDDREYKNDLEKTDHLINSAIENIEIGLIPDRPNEPENVKRGRGSKYGGVNINRADTILMGDHNLVNAVNSVTISDFLTVLQSQIEKKVAGSEQKKGILQKLKDISENPTVTTILDQTVGQILKSTFGS
jgi:hypothetical protein